MPKKTNTLERFHVHSPDIPMADDFKEFLATYWKMTDWEEMNDWLRSHRKYAEPEAWGFQESNTLAINYQKQDGAVFITCAAFFEKCRVLPERFSVLEAHVFNNAMPRIDILFDERQRQEVQAALDEDVPFKWAQHPSYLFGRSLWTLTNEDKIASKDELRLLFLEAVDAERQKFERLRNKFSGVAGARQKPLREAIAEKVKIFVWRRDAGKCVTCGSRERLEFDHIIPVEKGGSSTERNIELLCEACNRKKSNQI
jgi:hypothetical protein